VRENIRFHEIKPEIRILGIDDCSFTPRRSRTATLVGLVFRGGQWLDGAMKTTVAVDGLDATEKIIKMVKSSPHYDQLRIIMLNGITFAGFNIVDIKQLFEATGLPVIALTREEPNMSAIETALRRFSDCERRLRTIQEAGEAIKLTLSKGYVYTQLAGVSIDDAKRILEISCTNSIIPEPLRVAHIVASGLARSMMRKRKKV